MDLQNHQKLYLRQRRELAELFGFETRNKYEILDINKTPIAFAAEQQKGLLEFFFRQFLGHWRTFEVHIFDHQKNLIYIAKQPFRFIFQRLEVFTAHGEPIGALQQRFAIFKKRFDVENPRGDIILEMSSPFWKIWTFPFKRTSLASTDNSKIVAQVTKKWTGLLSEAFTDKDHFQIEFLSEDLTQIEKALILASGLFIDLRYFEQKAD